MQMNGKSPLSPPAPPPTRPTGGEGALGRKRNFLAVIFRLMGITRSDGPGLPLSLCGELAGRPEHTARLLECGIEAFSVAPPLMSAVKEAIRSFSHMRSPEPQATRSAGPGVDSNTERNEG